MSVAPYQDWSSYTVPSADAIVGEDLPAVLSHIGPKVDCSPWPYVEVSFNNAETTVYYQCSLSWEGYVPINLFTGNTYFCVGPGQLASMVVPTRGRTVQFVITTVTGSPTNSFSYGISGLGHRVEKYDVPSYKGVLMNDISGYASPESKFFQMNYWYEGPVMVTCNGGGGGFGFAILSYYDINTAGWEQYQTIPILASTSGYPTRVHFPPAPVQMEVMNQGSAMTIGTEIIPISF